MACELVLVLGILVSAYKAPVELWQMYVFGCQYQHEVGVRMAVLYSYLRPVV